MSTVTYRGGILAADQLATCDGLRAGLVTKVRREADGSRTAILGSVPEALTLRDWFAGGREGPQPSAPGGALVAAVAGGVVMLFEDGHAQPLGDAPFHAFGSGRAIALGAMYAGASAEEAVRAAIAIDVHSGGDVDVLEESAG